MPLYEYYCDKCDAVFEALRSLQESEQPAPCPHCGGEAERIMPTSFSSMSRRDGYAQRVPFHQRGIRTPAGEAADDRAGESEGRRQA